MKKKISAAKLLKKITKEKDLVWRIAVKERDKYECQVCQKKVVGINAQAHHLIPRSFKDFRWDIDNGICLCFSCHAIGRFSAHINGIFFA